MAIRSSINLRLKTNNHVISNHHDIIYKPKIKNLNNHDTIIYKPKITNLNNHDTIIYNIRLKT